MVMIKSRSWIPKGDGKLIYEFLPGDASYQSHALLEGQRVLAGFVPGNITVTFVDLGCGEGDSYNAFCSDRHEVRWVGLDITDSQEVRSRPQRRLSFCAYDGVRIPLRDGAADIVYSRQVFEHVRYPQALMKEVHRVLRPGGVFVGSTSHLEPFHSRSYWNYTPYGFCVLLSEAGFRSVVVRPGIDCLTLIARRYFSYVKLAKCFEAFFTVESPMNLVLEAGLRLLGQPAKKRNLFKLLFSGQFCFVGHRPSV
jgi:SAM-dependent methyltransferase